MAIWFPWTSGSGVSSFVLLSIAVRTGSWHTSECCDQVAAVCDQYIPLVPVMCCIVGVLYREKSQPQRSLLIVWNDVSYAYFSKVKGSETNKNALAMPTKAQK